MSFAGSFRFLSSSLDSSVKTLVDKSHKKLKNLKGENVDNDDLLNTVNKIEEQDKTIEAFKKDYPAKVEKSEEALNNY